MSDAKRYYVRGVHWAKAGEATRECDCSWPCVKVVKAEDYDALVSRLEENRKEAIEFRMASERDWQAQFDRLKGERDAALLRLDQARLLAHSWADTPFTSMDVSTMKALSGELLRVLGEKWIAESSPVVENLRKISNDPDAG